AASRTTIPFELPESASVEIRLFDLQGRQMMTLTRGHFEAGRHEIGLDVSTLPSGAYFYEVRTGNGQRQTRMLMVLH
ncbi:MAG: T9SS C-terminal target domain-containing protein, partial [Bacteroidetes bacterium]